MTNRVELKAEMLENAVGGTYKEMCDDMKFWEKYNLYKSRSSMKDMYSFAYGNYGVEVDYFIDEPNVYKIDGETVTQKDAQNYVLAKLENKQ